MLRASYFYLPKHLEQPRPAHQHKVTPTAPEQTPKKRKKLSPGANAGIGVGTIVVAGVGIGERSSVEASGWHT
jgi:hypothetical protein